MRVRTGSLKLPDDELHRLGPAHAFADGYDISAVADGKDRLDAGYLSYGCRCPAESASAEEILKCVNNSEDFYAGLECFKLFDNFGCGFSCITQGDCMLCEHAYCVGGCE